MSSTTPEQLAESELSALIRSALDEVDASVRRALALVQHPNDKSIMALSLAGRVLGWAGGAMNASDASIPKPSTPEEQRAIGREMLERTMSRGGPVLDLATGGQMVKP